MGARPTARTRPGSGSPLCLAGFRPSSRAVSAHTLGVSGTGFPLSPCDPGHVFPPLKLWLLAYETRPCREAAGAGRWATHARTQALEPSSR